MIDFIYLAFSVFFFVFALISLCLKVSTYKGELVKINNMKLAKYHRNAYRVTNNIVVDKPEDFFRDNYEVKLNMLPEVDCGDMRINFDEYSKIKINDFHQSEDPIKKPEVRIKY